MRGHRPEADPRFTPHVSRFLGAGQEQSRCLGIIRRVERSMYDGLLRQANPVLQAGGNQQTTFSIDNDGLDIRQLFD